MARPGAIPRVIAAWIVATAASGLVPSLPALAADAATLILPGRTAAVLVTDMDGFGGREVVRILDDGGQDLQLEVWRDRDSGWTASQPLDVPSPLDDREDLAAYVPAAGLIEARQPGAQVPLVVVGGSQPGEFGPTTCCLTIFRLRLVGEQPVLETIADPAIAVDEVFVLDLDDDAVDELVIGSSVVLEGDEAPIRTYTAFRWDGTRYVVAGSHEVDGWASGVTVGDTDGVPGSELVLVSGDGVDLVRLSVDRGRFVSARTQLLDGGSWLVGAMGSRLVIMGGRAAIYEWPAGGGLTVAAEVADPLGDVFGIVGHDADALLLTIEQVTSGYGLAVSIDVYDAGLEHLARIEPSADAVALDELMSVASESGGWDFERSIWPYVGPTDWSDDGSETWILPGHAVIVDESDGLRVMPMPLLTGFSVGQAGTDNGWVAMCDGCWRERHRTALYSDDSYGTGQLRLTRSAQLLSDEPIEVDVTHPGALQVGSDPVTGAPELLGNPAGFELDVAAGPGVAIVSWDGRTLVDHGTTGNGLRITVAGPDEDELPDDRPFERTLLVIAPDGRLEIRTWRGTFAPAAPNVTAEMAMTVGSLEVEVSGTASELATVTVDGRPVSVAADGEFRTTIAAPPWPAEIIVTATDPFGTAVERTVEVIGLVDYRGLPWGAIATVATLGTAALLFLRVPQLRGTVPVAGDGSLEEIDAESR